MHNSLNSFFDAILVINMDKRTDRLNEVSEELSKHNIEAFRISGVDGKLVHPELTDVNRGWLGCTLSHINALKYAKDSGLKNILILEDDVRFSEKNLKLFADTVNELPDDWDMFYLGANDKHPETILHAYSDHLRKADFLLTTHAYAVNAKCFDVLLTYLQEHYTTVVDVLYTHLQPTLKCFLATPLMAWQSEGYSDILEQSVNYDFMKPE